MTIQAIAANLPADIKAFRSAAVASENKATPFARSLLAGLVSGLYTPALAESAVIHAFGNPKSPKSGKPVAKLSGLRDFTGGDAVRKTTESVFSLFQNVDVDAPRNVAEEGDEPRMIGAGAIRPLIVSFIMNEADAPKSLKSLRDAVQAALKAHAAAISPDNSDAKAETDAETEEATAPAASPSPAFNAADAIAMLCIHVQTLDLDGANALEPLLNSLSDAFNARCDVLMSEAAPMAEAA